MMTRDAVRALLQARGCPATVVQAGLAGLVDAWEAVVRQVEDGYPLTLDDYLNDMDLRDLVAAACDVAMPDELAAVSARLASADTRHRAHTEDAPCLWGEDIAEEDGLDPTREWWYFRRPVRPGESLREDLATWGLLP